MSVQINQQIFEEIVEFYMDEGYERWYAAELAEIDMEVMGI